jgi:hypothetical protein
VQPGRHMVAGGVKEGAKFHGAAWALSGHEVKLTVAYASRCQLRPPSCGDERIGIARCSRLGSCYRIILSHDRKTASPNSVSPATSKAQRGSRPPAGARHHASPPRSHHPVGKLLPLGKLLSAPLGALLGKFLGAPLDAFLADILGRIPGRTVGRTVWGATMPQDDAEVARRPVPRLAQRAGVRGAYSLCRKGPIRFKHHVPFDTARA